MTNVSTPGPGQVITFYSYRGGTGRTMALANVACLLARVGTDSRPILAIDWDLEAPGLHRFFRTLLKHESYGVDGVDDSQDGHPGLIDLLIETEQAIQGLDNSDLDDPDDVFDTLMKRVEPERFILETEIPSLHFLKAGRFDDEYSSRINRFQWEGFHNRVPWFFAAFAEWLA